MSDHMKKLLAKKAQIVKSIKLSMGGEAYLEIGDPTLDWAIGGWSRSHINLLYGPTKSGKSGLAAKGAGSEQKVSDGWIIVFDSEYAWKDPNEVEIDGPNAGEPTKSAIDARRRYEQADIDWTRLYIVSSNSMNTLFGDWPGLEEQIRSGKLKVSAIIWDSLRGVQSRTAVARIAEGEIDTSGLKIGGNAKDINPMIQSILGVCADCGITGFFVQHCMVNQDQYGPRWILVGGEMLKYLSTTIVFVESVNAKDASLLSGDVISKGQEDGNVTGHRVGKKIRIVCEKSRRIVEGRRGEFWINFENLQFALPEVSLFNLATNLGVIAHPLSPDIETTGPNKGKQKIDKQGNPVYKESIGYWEYPAGAPNPVKFHGQQQTLDELKSNKDLFNEITQACWLSKKTVASKEEFSEVVNG